MARFAVHPRRSGLSLLELLAALGIAAVLALVGVPALHDVVADARRTARVNALVRAAHLARGAAATRGLPVVLCPARNGDCSPEGDWRGGFIVFVNADGREPPRRDPAETVLVAAPPAGPLRLAANRRAFSFRPVSRRDTNGTIAVCDPRGPAASRAVIIAPSGRPRVAPGTDLTGDLNCNS